MFESTRRAATPDSLRSVRVERAPLLKRVKRDLETYKKLKKKQTDAARLDRIRELESELRELKRGAEARDDYGSHDRERTVAQFQRVIDLLTASTATHVVLKHEEVQRWAGEENSFIADLRKRSERRLARAARHR